MSRAQDLDPIARCEALFAGAGFLTLDPIFAAAGRIGTATDHGIDAAARALCEAYNHSAESRARLARAARAGDAAAANTLAWMETQGLDPAPCRPLAPEEARILHGRLEAEPEGFLNRGLPYPASVADRHWGFAPGWTGDRLALGRARLDRMRAGRRGDVAVLVGNGPSLRQTDLTLLAGQDVFISNYALRHSVLGQLALGVGVSNYFVAAQAPQLFHPVFRDRPVWRVLPVWLGHVLADSPETIWLNATGGGLFFSEAPESSRKRPSGGSPGMRRFRSCGCRSCWRSAIARSC